MIVISANCALLRRSFSPHVSRLKVELKRTRSKMQDANSAGAAMALQDLRLGKVLRQKIRQNLVGMLAALPRILSSTVEHLGMRYHMGHLLNTSSEITGKSRNSNVIKLKKTWSTTIYHDYTRGALQLAIDDQRVREPGYL